MFNKILVVCVGNICRSPLGECLLKQALPEKEVFSAGIASLKSKLVGAAADATMIEVANANEIDLSAHKSKQLTAELCQDADLILVMEKKHIEMVEAISPSSRGKIMLYGHWLQKDIPDPYKQSKEAFEYVFQLIQEAAASWTVKLK